jgi:hypothetical protein
VSFEVGFFDSPEGDIQTAGDVSPRKIVEMKWKPGEAVN